MPYGIASTICGCSPKVVESGSFAGAAARLGISPSMVSQHVKEREQRLGARLLNRTTRKLSLTETGRAYYEHCTRLLTDLEKIEQAVSDMHAAPRGELRVNPTSSFGILQLAPAIADFTTRFPAISIELMLSERMADLIEEGFDVAVRVEEVPDSSLIARQLAPCRMVVCGSPCYIISPMGNLRTNSGAVLMVAALAGHGLVCLPTYLVSDALKSRRLVTVLDDYVAPPYTLRALYPHNRHLSAKVRAFVDFVAARFGRDPTDRTRRVREGGPGVAGRRHSVRIGRPPAARPSS